MFKLLFILFLIVPLIEISILIQIGKVIGAGYTISLVIGTAVLGAALLREQGLSTLAKVQSSMDQGILPAIELVEGLILLVAGVMLLTPGFFTDIFGFIILIPFIRKRIAQILLKNFLQTHIKVHETASGTIIEGEHWETSDQNQQIRNDNEGC